MSNYQPIETAFSLVSLRAFHVGQRILHDAYLHVLTSQDHTMNRSRLLHHYLRCACLHTIHVFPLTTFRWLNDGVCADFACLCSSLGTGIPSRYLHVDVRFQESTDIWLKLPRGSSTRHTRFWSRDVILLLGNLGDQVEFPIVLQTPCYQDDQLSPFLSHSVVGRAHHYHCMRSDQHRSNAIPLHVWFNKSHYVRLFSVFNFEADLHLLQTVLYLEYDFGCVE